MPHDLRSIEVFTEDGWLCTACPQHALTPEESDAVVETRREAAREMGRRKAAASRRARTRIAPLTASGTVQDITAITRDRRERRAAAASNAQVDAALRVLGLGDQLNTVIPTAAATDDAQRETGA